jgi:hypothetical protein
MDLAIDHTTGLTRRALLCAGATAGAAVVLGVRPWAASAAGGGYLTRSAYAGLEGTEFTVETGARTVALRLESVSDLAGAASQPALVGSDDAFALMFSGPLSTPLDSGIHTLHHPRLGTFELFSSPVDDPDRDQRYEVVVDRSVGVPGEPPEAPPKAPEAEVPSPESPPARTEPEPVEPRPLARVVRRASLRRSGRWARCEVDLRRSAEAVRVRCRLLRKGKVLASATRRVTDQHAVMRLEAVRPLAAGSYTLVVTAIDADGVATSERRRVTLR